MAEEIKKEQHDNYNYRFEELLDEIENSLNKLRAALVANANIRLKLNNANLSEDDDFKEIINNMAEQYKVYDEQVIKLEDRQKLGKQYLELVKDNDELNKAVTILMNFLGVFKK